MRGLVAAMFLLLAFAAQAASPEEPYLAARDHYIATFRERESQPLDDGIYNQHDAAMKDLERQLSEVVGPFAAPGFSQAGTINLDTLFPSDQGFGLLDGLVFASDDGKTHIVVTTRGIFMHWLKEHENWWPDFANVPQELEPALRSEEFYTQGISTDAAVSIYADIPIARPAKAGFVVALLAGRSQDVVPLIPDEVIVSVATGNRVFVATVPTTVTVTAIPACDLLWQDFQKRADEAYGAYTASDPNDEALFDAYSKIQEDGSEAIRNCFAGYSPREAFFAALVEQAQALADSLPAE